MNKDPGTHYGKGLGLMFIPFLALILAPVLLIIPGLRPFLDYAAKNAFIGVGYFIGLVILAVFPIFVLLRRMSKRDAYVKNIRDAGIDAAAEIMRIERTGTVVAEGVNERLGVAMELTVRLPGGETYSAFTEHFVPMMNIPKFQPGAVIQVKVNPSDKSQVVVV